jgi:dipeptidyl aminopeptidase/acylaminoacyl peptidase
MPMRRPLYSTVAALTLAVMLLAPLGARPAKAAFPGTNGVIAYEKAGDIWLTNSDGVDSFSVNLTNSPASDREPSVSPDGRKVAFDSDLGSGSDPEIFILDLYTGARRQLTSNATFDGDPAWSPDGRTLAYVAPTDVPGRSDWDLWIRNTDGTGTRTNFTSTSTASDLSPSWSPDGNEIAFHAFDIGDILIRGFGGATRTIGTDASPLSNYKDPSWSPDGSRIAYQLSAGSGNPEIWTMRASDGGDRRQLTNNAVFEEYPAYSPDGTAISFSRSTPDGYDLYTMSSADDGTATDEGVIDGSPESALLPDWGPAAPPASPGCTISGTFAADNVVGTAGNDTICALGGSDWVHGGIFGDDTIRGGAGNDEIVGHFGRDRLLGGAGRDTLDSRDGFNRNDFLSGGPDRDRCLKDRRELAVRSCP